MRRNMKRNLIIIVAVASLLLATIYWISYVPHFYKHSAVTSMVIDNKELLAQSVKEMDGISENGDLIKSVRESYKIYNQDYKVELEYVSRIDKEEFYTDDWRGKSHQELANQYGMGVADRIYLLKDIDGLYACFSYEDDEGIQECYVQINNETLNRVFDETDVKMIFDWTDSVYYRCYEKFKETDMEFADFFYQKSGQPDPPSGEYAKTKKTKNGWLYKSQYSMSYLEKITGQFYYIDDDGHDAI